MTAQWRGGGYWVWDSKRRVVVESGDVIFVELTRPTIDSAVAPPLQPAHFDSCSLPAGADATLQLGGTRYAAGNVKNSIVVNETREKAVL